MSTTKKHEPLTAKAQAQIETDPRFQHLTTCIYAVWQEIGSDSLACAQECGERLTNEGKLEGCLDADRMTTLVKDGKAADDYAGELFDRYGYRAVEKLLSRRIRL